MCVDHGDRGALAFLVEHLLNGADHIHGFGVREGFDGTHDQPKLIQTSTARNR